MNDTGADIGNGQHECRQCGHRCGQGINYCPHCGAYIFETELAAERPDDFEFQAPDGRLVRPQGGVAINAIAVDRAYPSFWIRLAAAVLDYLFLALTALPGMIAAQLGAFGVFGPAAGEAVAGGGIIVSSLGFVGVCVYNMVRLSTKGQTIAKAMFKIKIVRRHDQSSNPGFTRAVLLRALMPGLIFGLPYLGGLLFIMDSLLIFREDRRCGHDFLAGTIVVRA